VSIGCISIWETFGKNGIKKSEFYAPKRESWKIRKYVLSSGHRLCVWRHESCVWLAVSLYDRAACPVHEKSDFSHFYKFL